MKRLGLSLCAASLALCLVCSPASAKKHSGSGDYRGHSQKNAVREEQKERDQDRFGSFDDERRGSIRSYLREEYQHRCPPGLADKGPGCMPPGQAKLRYRIGEPFVLERHPLPEALIVRLGPPPAGAFYTRVDDDVLLVSEASKKIIDAVTLLSAVDGR